MSHIAIQAEGLAKQYRIGALQDRHGVRTLGERLTGLCMAPFRRARRLAAGAAWAGQSETIWALRDASFQIREGQVVGLIGRNGSGKSTLLKVLSRITEPTKGHVDVHGRVGSLLEVGTGFHQELTGRENIYLNGAILGMKKAEIAAKFDEIVAFAEIERFLDTPVKHYSSGMFVRLAFAVAAHLEPEILLVDEVLAVGDSRFQKRCLNKMEDVAHGGRTVVFVSHNMSAVTRICPRAILLEEGRVVREGPSDQIVGAYLSAGLGTKAAREWEVSEAPAGDVCRLLGARVRTREGEITDTIDIRRPVSIEIEFEVLRPGFLILPHFHLWNDDGIHVFSAHDVDPAWRRRRRPEGRYVSTGWIPGNFLSEGMLFVDVVLVTIDPLEIQVFEPSPIGFQVVDSMDGDTARGDYGGPMRGAVRPLLEWTTSYVPS